MKGRKGMDRKENGDRGEGEQIINKSYYYLKTLKRLHLFLILFN